MFDAIKTLIVVLLVVLSLVIIPLPHSLGKLDDKAMNYAEQSVRSFVDEVRRKGYIDPRDYIIMKQKLDATGEVFLVALEHRKKRYQPLYEDPDDFYTFTEQFEVLFTGHFTREILDRIFPEDGTPENSPSRRYRLGEGDMFDVRIETSGPGFASQIQSIVWGGSSEPNVYHYGGMVRDEAP